RRVIVLSGAEVVLPDRVLSPGTVVIDDGRIVEIKSSAATPGGTSGFAFHGHYIVPGFIDVHVHGVEGVDSLGGDAPVVTMARRFPRFGVTAFCPTTVACSPTALRGVLEQVRRAREIPDLHAARVLPAHLESNFINPEYKGAQPLRCLRNPRIALASRLPSGQAGQVEREGEHFDGAEVLREIEQGT